MFKQWTLLVSLGALGLEVTNYSYFNTQKPSSDGNAHILVVRKRARYIKIPASKTKWDPLLITWDIPSYERWWLCMKLFEFPLLTLIMYDLHTLSISYICCKWTSLQSRNNMFTKFYKVLQSLTKYSIAALSLKGILL